MDTALLAERPPLQAEAEPGSAPAAALVPAPAAPRAEPACVIAVVQACGQRIGIDGAQVVQAVVVPQDLVAVPRRAGGIAGVMRRGGQVIPVVRLENWLEARADAASNADAPAPADARIVVLREGAQVVGLWVDAVVGMQRSPAQAVSRLFHDERADELFARAVLLDAAAPPLMLLETSRLAALAGVWAEAAGIDTATAATSTVGAAVDTTRHAAALQDSLGVFRVGDRLVGVPSADIGELLRMPVLNPPPYRHAAARGMCEWRGRLLPVVDLTEAIGAVPEPAGTSPVWLCVLRLGESLLGLLVHELVELRTLDGELPPLATGLQRPLVRCEWPLARGLLQVLDIAALMARYPESALSGERSSASAHAGSRAATAQVASPHTYAVFDAAGGYAARIDCVQEVVPIPEDLRPRLNAGLAVSLSWRGHAVPVRGLFADDTLCVPPADARQLIIVEAGERRLAIPIVAMKAMIAPRSGTLSRMRAGNGTVTIVSTMNSETQASYQVVDLEQRVSEALAG